MITAGCMCVSKPAFWWGIKTPRQPLRYQGAIETGTTPASEPRMRRSLGTTGEANHNLCRSAGFEILSLKTIQKVSVSKHFQIMYSLFVLYTIHKYIYTFTYVQNKNILYHAQSLLQGPDHKHLLEDLKVFYCTYPRGAVPRTCTIMVLIVVVSVSKLEN